MSPLTPLLEIDDLHVTYPGTGRRTEPLAAVNGVSLRIAQGETVGLVGESGSGKSTIGKAVVGLAQPSSGRIVLAGHDITHLPRRERRGLAHRVQLVVRQMSHRVAVLQHGELVEEGPALQVTTAPAHPYTQALLAAVPVPAACGGPASRPGATRAPQPRGHCGR